MSYPVTSIARLSVSFTLANGTPADPTTITLMIGKPNGTSETVTGGSIVRDGTGEYHYDYTVDQEGLHSYRWQGTGAVEAATPTQTLLGI